MRARSLVVASLLVGVGLAIAACVTDGNSNNIFENEGGALANDDGATSSSTDGASSGDAGKGGADASDGSASSSDTGVDAAPAPAVLDQMGEIALWLEASAANYQLDMSGRVVEWKDLSQNKNHATCSAGTCPAVNANAIAGHDSVLFSGDGAPLKIKDSTTLQFGTDHVAIFAVVKTLSVLAIYTKDTCNANLHTCGFATGLQLAPVTFQADGGDGGFLHDFGVAMADDVNGASFQYGDSVFDDAKFHIVGARRYNNGSNLKLYVDERDASDNATSPTDISQATNGVTIGPIPNDLGKPTATLDVAEIIIMHAAAGVLADKDVESIRTYLSKKYGL